MLKPVALVFGLLISTCASAQQLAIDIYKLPLVVSPKRLGTMATGTTVVCPPAYANPPHVCTVQVTVRNDPTESNPKKSCTGSIDFDTIEVTVGSQNVFLIFELVKDPPNDPHVMYFAPDGIKFKNSYDPKKDVNPLGPDGMASHYFVTAANGRKKNHPFDINVRHLQGGMQYPCAVVDPTIANLG